MTANGQNAIMSSCVVHFANDVSIHKLMTDYGFGEHNATLQRKYCIRGERIVVVCTIKQYIFVLISRLSDACRRNDADERHLQVAHVRRSEYEILKKYARENHNKKQSIWSFIDDSMIAFSISRSAFEFHFISFFFFLFS